jgi:hypothetical protein
VVVSVLQARDEVVGGDPRGRPAEEEDELAVPAVSDNSGGEPDGRVMLWPTTSGQEPFNETL